MNKNLIKENELVLKIHNEIDSAQDRLLVEAKKLLDDNYISETTLDKVQRLKNLGFTSTEEVVNINKKIINNKMTTELANTVNHYKETYPFLKFLTIEEFDRICDKYDLIYAPVSKYKRNVPEENILEIESAQKLSYNDILSDISILKVREGNTCLDKLTTTEKNSIYDTGFEIETSYLLKLSNMFGYSPDNVVSKFLGRPVHFRLGNMYCDVIKIIDKSGLFIAAPKSHFSLNKLEQIEKHGFFKTVIIPEPKDPIVFRFVKGGLQVLSKWGIEGNDKDLNTFNIN